MATNALETAHANGDVIDASHINEITLALLGQFVGRNGTGIPVAGQDLGTTLIPWGNVYAQNLILNNIVVDPSKLSSKPNRIISGRTINVGETKSNFIRPSGTGLSFQILGQSIPLNLSINDTLVTVNTDITVSGITPMSSTLTDHRGIFVNTGGGEVGLLLGEEDNADLPVIMPSTGANKDKYKTQQWVAIHHIVTDEILFGPMLSSGTISGGFRGYFFDSIFAPFRRGAIATGDSFDVLSLGWVFMDANAVTVDVSYTTPVKSKVAPSSPAAGDYWYNLSTQQWNRYSGSTWVIINRILIGVVAANSTAVVAARSFDYDKNFEETNDVELFEYEYNDGVASPTYFAQTKNPFSRISINGNLLELDFDKSQFRYPEDMDGGPDLGGDSVYYFYLKDDGTKVISTSPPYKRPDMKGYYHPYNTWRCVGEGKRDSANSKWFQVSSFLYNENLKEQFARFADQKGATVDAGSSIAGEQSRNIFGSGADNYDPNSIVIKSVGNVIYLARGLYEFEGSAPASEVGFHQVNLKITSGTGINVNRLYGTNEKAPVGSQTTSFVKGRFFIPEDGYMVELRHYTQAVVASTGLGEHNGTTFEQIYARLSIKRVKHGK